MAVNTIGAGVILNEGSIDVDFRVESNGSANMLFVDGGNDRVGIGIDSPDGTLHVHTATAGSVTANSISDDLVIENSAGGGLTVLTPDANDGRISIGSASDNIGAALIWNYDSGLFTIGSDKVGGQTVFTSNNGNEAMRIDASKNVGIGKTDPVHELSIATTATSGPALELQFDLDGSIVADHILGEIIFSGNDANINSSGGGQADNTSIGAKIVATATAGWDDITSNDADDSPSKLEFYTQNAGADNELASPRMTIDSGGKVGIGTVSPDHQLEVSFADTTAVTAANIQSNAVSGIHIATQGNDTTAGGVLKFSTANDSINAAIAIEQMSSVSADMVFFAEVSGNFEERFRINSGSASFAGNGTFGGTTKSQEMSTIEISDISTGANRGLNLLNISGTDQQWNITTGVTGSENESFCIRDSTAGVNGLIMHSSTCNATFLGAITTGKTITSHVVSGTTVGLVCQNDTSAVDSSNVLVDLDYTSDETATGAYFVKMQDYGGEIGSIKITGGATIAFNTSSDYRLKENEVLITDGLKMVNSLKPYRFNMKGNSTVVDGFFAHEVAPFVPSAVDGEKDAVDDEGEIIRQSMDYSKLVTVMVGAIQELSAEVEKLKNA